MQSSAICCLCAAQLLLKGMSEHESEEAQRHNAQRLYFHKQQFYVHKEEQRKRKEKARHAKALARARGGFLSPAKRLPFVLSIALLLTCFSK